jgi:hypothetical protein
MNIPLPPLVKQRCRDLAACSLNNSPEDTARNRAELALQIEDTIENFVNDERAKHIHNWWDKHDKAQKT